MAEVAVHPGAEIGVDPALVEGQLGVGDGVVPDGDALLVVRNARELQRDDLARQLVLPVEAALVDALSGPQNERQRCRLR